MALALVRLRGVARRYSRRREEAEDLLQDALAKAVAAGRTDMAQPANMAWLVGVLRNRATEVARGAARRRARESTYAERTGRAVALSIPDRIDWSRFPPALRIVARLVLSGHTRGEISYLLGLSDATLRQRIAALRRKLVQAGGARPSDFSGLWRPLAYGSLRRALRHSLERHGGRLGAHDPDGHLFLISESDLTKTPRAATYRGNHCNHKEIPT
ncbi:RNA polymerase sigma factor [Microbulbifer rhizosphaerae]|uniref:RNA polymerase sigma-70 factor (ECF subfamily) n=1 Tax=Microbulbifer rhizosphaerae TaxID=1562603 RepID=A0A7W4Z8A2_9GAMM|nr:sigma-70 family RNA polymerase sigma factor [Microbulbifer rhizosphaerae]MBB3060372.1 RNA polymerase sigma-70 factor (ECF subfamily) [Microbulbifer rhizosphaerae]